MEEYRAPAELLNEKGKLTRSGWSAQDDFIYNKENAGENCVFEKYDF